MADYMRNRTITIIMSSNNETARVETLFLIERVIKSLTLSSLGVVEHDYAS